LLAVAGITYAFLFCSYEILAASTPAYLPKGAGVRKTASTHTRYAQRTPPHSLFTACCLPRAFCSSHAISSQCFTTHPSYPRSLALDKRRLCVTAYLPAFSAISEQQRLAARRIYLVSFHLIFCWYHLITLLAL